MAQKVWLKFLFFYGIVAKIPGNLYVEEGEAEVVENIRRSKRIAARINMVSLSTEQFERLLSAVNQPSGKCGSFSSCSARYNGDRNPSKVEEFISAISTYKTIEGISDTNAVNGMPMLLEGDAAEWWRGVKLSAKTFADVVRMLRESFSPPKPAWRIYAEINELKQQKNEPTDSFIRKKRALFSQLSSCPAESDQIDMVFGLLHSQIRERLYRNKVKSFDELLADAREAEQVICERGVPNADVKIVSGGTERVPIRCSFCRKKGHSEENCFRRKNADNQVLKTDPIVVKPKFACYGCNAPGVVRANCPNCSQKRKGSAATSVSFNSLGLCVGRDIPVVNVELFGVPGQAYFDSGAKTSIASANLKRIMEFKGCKFDNIDCQTTLADGSTSIRKFFTTNCKIGIGGRSLDITFLIFPEEKNNRTLIGTDFMEQAGIVLNMGQQYWYFENCPTQVFDFAENWPLNLNLVETIKAVKAAEIHPKRKSTEVAAEHVEPKFVTPKRYCKTHVSDFEGYGPSYGKESDYSPHSIQAIFKDAIPSDMPTPDRNKDSGLFSGVSYRVQNEEPNAFFCHYMHSTIRY